jgi:hypothetical protein
MGFSSLDSSQRELSVVCHRLFLSLTVFKIIGVKDKKCYFAKYVKHFTVSKTIMCHTEYNNLPSHHSLFDVSCLLSTVHWCGQIKKKWWPTSYYDIFKIVKKHFLQSEPFWAISDSDINVLIYIYWSTYFSSKSIKLYRFLLFKMQFYKIYSQISFWQNTIVTK